MTSVMALRPVRDLLAVDEAVEQLRHALDVAYSNMSDDVRRRNGAEVTVAERDAMADLYAHIGQLRDRIYDPSVNVTLLALVTEAGDLVKYELERRMKTDG